ncbi:MAG TPA: ABC transporter permease [Candidatus Lachnoclostridium stercorigallinarum]|uniref:ABC transporter permease n=1 Tax=Candidatus Lachnoclostridium stercorigallinarum TaxID=2838634 RepID=A0A9D2K6E4_9FIRM|nr:ABC transporter permease [Candidatus Lachnoclostridium stercorigallinarum]
MLQSFKMAIKSILGNKMRSFLTMLGIIIGVASVIILVSIVNGYMSTVVDSFASMGVNQISVNVINLPSRSLDADDVYGFFEENRDLYGQMTPVVNVSAVVKHGNDSLDATNVGGYSEDYLDIRGYELAAGRNLQYSDMISRQKVCVAGYYVANELFGGPEKALGQTLKISGDAYKIIGVAEQQDEEELEEGGSDDFIWIPYVTATKLTRNGSISSYIFTSNSVDDTDRCRSQLESFLYETFQNEDLYNVNANSELLDTLNEQIGMMSGMLGGIAGISLLVAGVGVMNIMLVSVTERTREIGIRKALGAKRSVIMQQFVIEAAVTSSIGGIIGIVIGSVAAVALGNAMGIESPPTVGAILISFSVSVGIGLLFGYMPASRAAKLNPIDALRSE